MGDGDREINVPASHARDTGANWLYLRAWEMMLSPTQPMMSLESADKAWLSSPAVEGGGRDNFKEPHGADSLWAVGSSH